MIEPLSDADAELAQAMRRVYQHYGSPAEFFDAMWREEMEKNVNAESCKEADANMVAALSSNNLGVPFQAIEKAGFQPPGKRYLKPDPRGKEYGQFHAFVDEHSKIVVAYLLGEGRRGLGYTMKFDTVADFQVWATEST